MDAKTALPDELVQKFVGNAHGDLAAVTRLLEQEPALLNAAWDWGGGDWETGLGAAAHMGRRDIALFLLGKGARLDIFTAAMLDMVEIVRAIVESHPEARTAPGPHGIPLIAHAHKGEAAQVLAYLQTLPG